MNRFIVLWYLHMSVAAVLPHNDLNLLFIKNYISEWIHRTNYYNVINCEKSDGFRLAKMLAGDLRLFVSLLDANKPLRIMTNKPTTFILQLQCKQWVKILSEAENLNLFRTPYQWLLLDGFQYDTWNESKSSSHIHIGGIWTFLENLPLLIDSDFKITTVNPNGKISIMSAYKISATNNIIREYLAEWTAEKGLTIFNSASPAKRRWNLQGLTLKSSLVTVHPKSFLQMDTLIDRNKDTTSKVSFNVVILFEFLFNMSLQYKIVSDYGIPLKNGSWTGMVGDFQRGVVEIASSPLFPQKHRLSIVEYYAQASDSRGKFIFLSPPLSHSQNVFELPFNRIVWLCCFILFLLSCCLLYAALNCEQFGNGESDKTEKVSLSEIMIINIAALCQQGTSTQTWKPAGRIIALVVYLAYMSLYISYSAAIVVIFQSSDTSLQTISDLLQTPIKAGADNASYSQYYFTHADDEIHKKFVAEKITPKGEPPHFLSPEEGIKKVRNGMYAFHVETSVGYEYVQKTFTEDEKCGLQESKMSFFGEITPWFVMRKNSPYSKLLKIGMRKIIEAGFRTRSIRRFYTQKPKCGSKRSRFVSIGIIDSYFAFLLLGCGISLSIIIMLAEVITKKYLKKAGKKMGPPEPYDFISNKDRRKN